MKYLVIIPARAGSKGIKGKNTYPLFGKPLIEYTLELCRKVLLSTDMNAECVVSTDSEEIMTLAIEYGIEVPFKRDENLSDDYAKSIDVVLDVIFHYEAINKMFDAVVLLQPTSPLRTYTNLVEAIEKFEDSKGDSLISVKPFLDLSSITYKKDLEYAIPINDDHSKGIRRQDFEELYIRNGAFYITSIDYIKANRKFIEKQPIIYIMDEENSVNIDSIMDVYVAEAIMKARDEDGKKRGSE